MDDDPLSLPAVVDSLEWAQDFLARRAHEAGLEQVLADRLALALEEVFVNICHYAYPDAALGAVELRSWSDSARFILEIVDHGRPFDGLSLPDPDTSAGLEERAVGGLGWFLARQVVSELHYRREDERNIVRLVMRLDCGGAKSVGTH
jgi:serine/threonine-protein kinase RsbW